MVGIVADDGTIFGWTVPNKEKCKSIQEVGGVIIAVTRQVMELVRAHR